jgi:hypothetical protein
MFMRCEYLSKHPRVFRSMTGLGASDFDTRAIDVEPCHGTTEQKRLTLPDRTRAPGGGHPFELDYRNSLSLTTIWLRQYPTEHYSGKKKQVTRKTQVRVGWDGHICHTSESVPSPTADITLLKDTGVLNELPEDVGAWRDSAYQGIRDLHPQGLGAHPHKKPRGKPLPPEDKAYNTALSRERIIVEHRIGHIRHFQSTQQMHRHNLDTHSPTVIAVVGLLNRRREWRAAMA